MADINVAPGILQAPANLYQQILANQGTQANTALTQQQAQGAALANQKAGMQLEAYKGLLGMLSQQQQEQAATSPAQQQSQDQSGVDEAPTLPGGHIDKGAIASQVDGQFQQAAYIPSARIRMINAASAASGAPELGQAYMAAEKAQWDQQMQSRQIGASATLQQAYGLQDAVKAGNGIAALRDLDKGAAASLEAKGKALGWSAAELNSHVGEWADAVGGAVFRHTGREINDNNGTPYDKQAGRPVPGGARGPLSSAQLAEAYKEANDTITVGAGLPTLRYKALGFATPGDYVEAKKASGSDAPLAPPAAAQAPPAAAAPAPAPATPKPTIAAPTPSNAATAASPAKPPAPASNVAGVKPEAFQDDAFKTPAVPRPTDQVSLKAAQDQQALNIKNTNEFKASVNANAGIANMTKPYLDLAQKYLESGGVISGWGAEQRLELSKLAAKSGIPAEWLGDPSKTEAVIKNLGNASLQGARAVYGSRMSTNEVNLQMTRLTPNTHQQPEAMLALIKEARAQAQYDIDTSHLAPTYLNHGYDPQQFEAWQDKYHNRSQFIQSQSGEGTKAAPSITRRGLVNGQRVAQYSDGSIRPIGPND